MAKLSDLKTLLADAEPNERVPRQVAIQGEKLCAIAGRVPKDNERAIIHGRGIVRKGVNDAVERGVNRTARFDKKIHAQVDGASFVGGIRAGAKERRRIQTSRFAVAPHADGNARAFHLAE